MVVSESTGTFSLRATFANPDRVLLPGMFVRATVDLGNNPHAFLVPQRAVTFNAAGEPTVLVAEDGKAVTHVLTIDGSVDNAWLVTAGINDGDQVIVDGLQKVSAGSQVKPLEVTIDADGVVQQTIDTTDARRATEMSDITPGAAAPRRSLASFFIARPIFAIVLAIVTMLGGVLGIYSLSISQYPEIAPTTIRVGATYSGASAEAVENSVTTTIEDAMTGLDGLLYMEFDLVDRLGHDHADLLQFHRPRHRPGAGAEQAVAHREAAAADASSRPGVTVSRSPSGILMIGNIVSDDGHTRTQQLADIMTNRIEDPHQADRRRRLDPVVRLQLRHAHLARSGGAASNTSSRRPT